MALTATDADFRHPLLSAFLHSTHCFALRTCHKSKSTYSAKVSKLLQNKQSNSRQHQRQRQPPEQFVPRVSRWLVGECAKYISATTGTATDADDATRTIKSTPFAVAHLLLNNWRALRPPTSDPCPTFEPSWQSENIARKSFGVATF